MMNYRKKVELFFEELLDTIYPIRQAKVDVEFGDVKNVRASFLDLLYNNVEKNQDACEDLLFKFLDFISNIKPDLNKDVDAIYNGDPAAKSHNEIIMAYPGFYAIAAYRVAHFLHNEGVPLIPRIITEIAHTHTGIDIHPGAKIGTHLCIDHGTGVVIGETTVIGNHVKIYQGVTLGALSVPERDSKGQRHPTIEDNVVIYAQAIILGGETVIGHNSVIGGNVWLTESVPPFSKVYYKNPQTNIQPTLDTILDGNH